MSNDSPLVGPSVGGETVTGAVGAVGAVEGEGLWLHLWRGKSGKVLSARLCGSFKAVGASVMDSPKGAHLSVTVKCEGQTVAAAIAAAIGATAPGGDRVAALKAVSWVLRSGSMYVGPVVAETLETPLVADVGAAQVYDGRDNEDLKARFFASVFGAPFVAELVNVGGAS